MTDPKSAWPTIIAAMFLGAALCLFVQGVVWLWVDIFRERKRERAAEQTAKEKP